MIDTLYDIYYKIIDNKLVSLAIFFVLGIGTWASYSYFPESISKNTYETSSLLPIKQEQSEKDEISSDNEKNVHQTGEALQDNSHSEKNIPGETLSQKSFDNNRNSLKGSSKSLPTDPLSPSSSSRAGSTQNIITQVQENQKTISETNIDSSSPAQKIKQQILKKQEKKTEIITNQKIDEKSTIKPNNEHPNGEISEVSINSNVDSNNTENTSGESSNNTENSSEDNQTNTETNTNQNTSTNSSNNSQENTSNTNTQTNNNSNTETNSTNDSQTNGSSSTNTQNSSSSSSENSNTSTENTHSENNSTTNNSAESNNTENTSGESSNNTENSSEDNQTNTETNTNQNTSTNSSNNSQENTSNTNTQTNNNSNTETNSTNDSQTNDSSSTNTQNSSSSSSENSNTSTENTHSGNNPITTTQENEQSSSNATSPGNTGLNGEPVETIVDSYFENEVDFNTPQGQTTPLKIISVHSRSPIQPIPAECPTGYSRLGVNANIFMLSSVLLPYTNYGNSMKLSNELIHKDKVDYYFKIFHANGEKVGGVIYKIGDPGIDYHWAFSICLQH